MQATQDSLDDGSKAGGMPAQEEKRETARAEPMKLLGMEFSGHEGRYGSSADDILLLRKAGLELLSRKRVSGDSVQWLLGHLGWKSLPKRFGYACLEASYSFAKRARGRQALWPKQVKLELRRAIGLLPCLYSDLCKRVPSVAFAVDAAGGGGWRIWRLWCVTLPGFTTRSAAWITVGRKAGCLRASYT